MYNFCFLSFTDLIVGGPLATTPTVNPDLCFVSFQRQEHMTNDVHPHGNNNNNNKEQWHF